MSRKVQFDAQDARKSTWRPTLLRPTLVAYRAHSDPLARFKWKGPQGWQGRVKGRGEGNTTEEMGQKGWGQEYGKGRGRERDRRGEGKGGRETTVHNTY